MTENQNETETRKPGPIGERLQKIMHQHYLNMNSLSTRLHLPSNSVITRIVRDPSRGMSLELIQKILFEFPDISADWFVTGRGEMLLTKDQFKPEFKSDLNAQLAQKEEIIKTLNLRIKDKEEIIATKEALIANLEERDRPEKRVASI
jgi:hypothetical protein